MGKVVFDNSMSLDGFTTGPDPRPEEPNGDGGMPLVEWAFEGGEENRRLLEEAVAGLGAAIAGRRTYDLSVPFGARTARPAKRACPSSSSPTSRRPRVSRTASTPS
jgi:hypothetical protein